MQLQNKNKKDSLVQKNQLRNESPVKEKGVKKQADDGTAKEKITEASCNRGEEAMTEIAKKGSLRESNKAIHETDIKQGTKQPPGVGENRWDQI